MVQLDRHHVKALQDRLDFRLAAGSIDLAFTTESFPFATPRPRSAMHSDRLDAVRSRTSDRDHVDLKEESIEGGE